MERLRQERLVSVRPYPLHVNWVAVSEQVKVDSLAARPQMDAVPICPLWGCCQDAGLSGYIFRVVSALRNV